MRTADADQQADDGRAAPAEVVAPHQREDQQKRLTEKVTKPTQSIRRVRGSLDSAIWVKVMTTATTPMGTLTKKIQRQPMPLVMAPPISGPMATAPPITAP